MLSAVAAVCRFGASASTTSRPGTSSSSGERARRAPRAAAWTFSTATLVSRTIWPSCRVTAALVVSRLMSLTNCSWSSVAMAVQRVAEAVALGVGRHPGLDGPVDPGGDRLGDGRVGAHLGQGAVRAATGPRVTRVFASIASMSAVETSVATVCWTAGSSARGARVSTNVSVSVMVRSAQRAPTANGARRLATMMSRAAMIRRAMRATVAPQSPDSGGQPATGPALADGVAQRGVDSAGRSVRRVHSQGDRGGALGQRVAGQAGAQVPGQPPAAPVRDGWRPIRGAGSRVAST